MLAKSVAAVFLYKFAGEGGKALAVIADVSGEDYDKLCEAARAAQGKFVELIEIAKRFKQMQMVVAAEKNARLDKE